MPQIRGKGEVVSLARAYATTNNLVYYRHRLYQPIHFMTKEPGLFPAKETVWQTLTDRAILELGNDLGILFTTDAEVRSFKLILRQFSQAFTKEPQILVRMGEDEVKILTKYGELEDATGEFVPNYLDVPYTPDNKLKDRLFQIITEWVGSEEQAHSLLYHLATSLQPTWSAVKYVLLIGEGRNGKGTLIKMIEALFGRENISNVTRPDMARKSPIITTLNGMLLNLVYDGPKEFIKDSSTEKTLIAGEPVAIEMKYENAPATVQTQALFLEALNEEPYVADKSPALQKRLARFSFPNVYERNITFERGMMKERMLAALLELLIEHWVEEHEVADKLQLTAKSLDLQLESVWNASSVIRFLEHIASRDPSFLKNLVDKDMRVDQFLPPYRAWMEENGYGRTEDRVLISHMNECFVMDRKSFWIEKKNTTRRYIKAVRPDTLNAINVLLRAESLEDILNED